MFHRLKTYLLAPVLGALLLSCEPGALDPLQGPLSPETAVRSTQSEYTLVTAVAPSDVDLTASELIGASGGTVSLLGHSISVPAGAVSQPTVFTITLLTNGYLEVDLTAVAVDPLGNVVDVGEEGFLADKTVTLTMSYSAGTNIDDPNDLLILRAHEDGSYEPLPSVVDVSAETVTTELDHFSRYCMGMT